MSMCTSACQCVAAPALSQLRPECSSPPQLRTFVQGVPGTSLCIVVDPSLTPRTHCPAPLSAALLSLLLLCAQWDRPDTWSSFRMSAAELQATIAGSNPIVPAMTIPEDLAGEAAPGTAGAPVTADTNHADTASHVEQQTDQAADAGTDQAVQEVGVSHADYVGAAADQHPYHDHDGQGGWPVDDAGQHYDHGHGHEHTASHGYGQEHEPGLGHDYGSGQGHWDDQSHPVVEGAYDPSQHATHHGQGEWGPHAGHDAMLVDEGAHHAHATTPAAAGVVDGPAGARAEAGQGVDEQSFSVRGIAVPEDVHAQHMGGGMGGPWAAVGAARAPSVAAGLRTSPDAGGKPLVSAGMASCVSL